MPTDWEFPHRLLAVSERNWRLMRAGSGTTDELTVAGSALRRFGLDSLGYFMASAVSALVGLASSYLFTRLFAPGPYGQYSLALAVVAPMVVVISEWAAQPVGRFYNEYRTSGATVAYRRVIVTLWKYVVGFSFGAAWLLVSSTVRSWGWGLALGAAANVIVDAGLSLVLPIIPASLESALYRRIQAARAVLRFGVAVCLVYVLGAQPAYLVWASVVASLVVTPSILSSVNRLTRPGIDVHTVNSASHHSFASETLGEHIHRFARYGLPMAGWFFASQLLAVGDRYVIQMYLGNDAVGIYSANYNLIASAAGLLSGPVTFAAFPIIMRLWAEGRKHETALVLRDMTGWFFVLGLGMVFGTALVARDLVSVLLGSEFRSGYSVLVPIVVGLVLWSASMLGHKTLELHEATLVMVAGAGVAALLNLVLNLLFIPRYGMLAAAYTTAVGYATYTLGIWRISRRTDLPWQIPWHMLGRSAAAGLLAYAVVAVWTRGMEHGTLVALLQKAAGFSVLYLLLSAVLVVGPQRRRPRVAGAGPVK